MRRRITPEAQFRFPLVVVDLSPIIARLQPGPCAQTKYLYANNPLIQRMLLEYPVRDQIHTEFSCYFEERSNDCLVFEVMEQCMSDFLEELEETTNYQETAGAIEHYVGMVVSETDQYLSDYFRRNRIAHDYSRFVIEDWVSPHSALMVHVDDRLLYESLMKMESY